MTDGLDVRTETVRELHRGEVLDDAIADGAPTGVFPRLLIPGSRIRPAALPSSSLVFVSIVSSNRMPTVPTSMVQIKTGIQRRLQLAGLVIRLK